MMSAKFEPWNDSLDAYEDMEEELDNLKDYVEVLEAYIEYVENCISDKELPLVFDEWLELEEDNESYQ